MRYLTDRKRAEGRGAAGSGTEHHKQMQISAILLALLTPFFIATVGCAIGGSHADVIAHFGRPFPAIVTGLMLVIGLNHFRMGAQIMIEDYWHGWMGQFATVKVTAISYLLMAAGLFALVKLAI